MKYVFAFILAITIVLVPNLASAETQAPYPPVGSTPVVCESYSAGCVSPPATVIRAPSDGKTVDTLPDTGPKYLKSLVVGGAILLVSGILIYLSGKRRRLRE